MTPTEILTVAACIVVVAIAIVIMFLARRRQKPIKATEETQEKAEQPKLQRTFEPVAPPPAYQDLKTDKKQAEAIPLGDIPIVTQTTSKAQTVKKDTDAQTEKDGDGKPKNLEISENIEIKSQETAAQPQSEKRNTDIPVPANDISPDKASADKLTQIKGLGPKANKILTELGITRFSQIAAWTEADIAEIDPKMGAFSGRITREHWVEQAKLLDSGDIATFESNFGALHP